MSDGQAVAFFGTFFIVIGVIADHALPFIVSLLLKVL